MKTELTHNLKTLATVGLASLGLAACSGDSDLPTIQNNVALTSFSGCQELEDYIEDTAVRTMRNRLDPDLQSHGSIGIPEIAFAQADSTRATVDSGGSAPNNYTGTNNQVQGVNEADFVKTDGTHIYAISGQKLYVVKSWPATELEKAATINFEGQPIQMFFEPDQKRLSVISNIFSPREETQSSSPGASPSQDIADVAVPCNEFGCGQVHSGTRLTVIDVSQADAPLIQKHYDFPGRYQNARRIKGVVRLVLSEKTSWPQNVKWYLEENETFLGFNLFEDGRYRRLMDENEDLIRSRTLDQWVSKTRVKPANGEEQAFDYDCTQFSAPNGATELGFTTVTTLNLDNETVSQASIVARANEVYANTESLYFTNRHWWWWSETGQRDWTYIFKLDISEGDRTKFAAAGGFEGHVLNQFSLDEHNGNLRVATTLRKEVENEDGDFWNSTTNRVTVLDENLNIIGQTRDVADGERIYSARFIGDRGFIVTFREVDPLFTIDLKDPKNPQIIGELKVPGFSTYIHPLDENHLITIGIHQPEPDASGAVAWDQRAIKLSMFDITDFANPKEKFTKKLGTTSASSEAVYEHKAFNFFAEKGLLAIPFSDSSWGWNENEYWSKFKSEIRVFSVDAETGFTSKGALSVSDVYREQNFRNWSSYRSPWVRRSVMADDYVYAISDAGIRAAHVDTLWAPLATVPFSN